MRESKKPVIARSGLLGIDGAAVADQLESHAEAEGRQLGEVAVHGEVGIVAIGTGGREIAVHLDGHGPEDRGAAVVASHRDAVAGSAAEDVGEIALDTRGG